ncbi:MAG: NADH-quinone oxidoreductase subunit J [Actinomycetota bacterium]|jgi:NADH-quinone oxidoreductase subunit J|nr:NADH-quinone oxidoreductase subunit J [Actinomycetota bacterium]
MSIHPAVLAATIPDSITFAIAAAISVIGALGVVLSRNPVHSALMLVMTLFGVAVLFVEENAQFLAAVQVIVYAGAIVVLFLFVIMLLGVDRREVTERDPLRGQRAVALLLGILGLVEVILLAGGKWPTGAHSAAGAINVTGRSNVALLGDAVFTTYLLPFEITSALLVIAVIGAVVLARRPRQAGDREQPQIGGGDIITADVLGPDSLIRPEIEEATGSSDVHEELDKSSFERSDP